MMIVARMLTRVLFGLLAVGLSAQAGMANSQMASHRALYEMRVARADPGAVVSQVNGQMVMEWAGTCTGYTTKQRMYTEIGNGEGGLNITDQWLTSWEASDGSAFEFALSVRINGRLNETSRGTAHRGSATQKGTVEFKEPKGESRDLPRGTIFPTEHMADLLAAARSGQHAFSRLIFDGSAKEGLNEVSAIIGKRKAVAAGAGRANAVRGTAELARGAYWPVRLAFFKATGTDDMPEYTFSYRMLDNGVATDLLFDYGDFAIAGDLREIESITPPPCGKSGGR